MEFSILTEEEYRAFEENHPLWDFMNTAEAMALKRENGWETEYAGVKKDGKILLATPLASIPVMKIYRYYYAQRGFLADYRDRQTLAFFVQELKKYLKKKKGLYLLCDPAVSLKQRDRDGQLVEGGYDHSDVIEALEQNGFVYQGVRTDYSTASAVSWQFVLDLEGKSEAEVFKAFDQRTRWSINRSRKYAVQVREAGPDDLNLFLEMEKATAERRGFQMRDEDFYRKQLQAYGEHAKILIAYMDTEAYRNRLQEERKSLEKDKAENDAKLAQTPGSRKFTKKAKVIQEAIDLNEKNIKEAEELVEKYGKIINLAASFFIVYPREMIYLYSAADARFTRFNAPYAIQDESIRYAIAHQIPRYNFYGISGNFDEKADDYGVYQFKRGFNGTVEQQPGDFILPLRPAYSLYRKLKKR
jgi:peptidoglycan pentaglycine glycine transferase (the second and third glycine)